MRANAQVAKIKDPAKKRSFMFNGGLSDFYLATRRTRFESL